MPTLTKSKEPEAIEEARAKLEEARENLKQAKRDAGWTRTVPPARKVPKGLMTIEEKKIWAAERELPEIEARALVGDATEADVEAQRRKIERLKTAEKDAKRKGRRTRVQIELLQEKVRGAEKAVQRAAQEELRPLKEEALQEIERIEPIFEALNEAELAWNSALNGAATGHGRSCLHSLKQMRKWLS